MNDDTSNSDSPPVKDDPVSDEKREAEFRQALGRVAPQLDARTICLTLGSALFLVRRLDAARERIKRLKRGRAKALADAANARATAEVAQAAFETMRVMCEQASAQADELLRQRATWNRRDIPVHKALPGQDSWAYDAVAEAAVTVSAMCGGGRAWIKAAGDGFFVSLAAHRELPTPPKSEAEADQISNPAGFPSWSPDGREEC